MTHPSGPRDPAARFLWPIDVARFAFAALVACGHTYGFARLTHPEWHIAFIDRVQPGGLWVAGFFVMSGWCIAAAEVGRRHFSFERYVAARITRILPLYLVFLATTLVAEVIFSLVGGRTDKLWIPKPWTLLAQATMTQGIFGPFGAFNPSWSLTHEIVCYLVWGLLLVGVERRRSSLTMLAIAAVPFVLTAIVHTVVREELSWQIMSLPLYFFVWLLGAAAAESAAVMRDPRLRRRVALGGALFVIPLVAYFVDRRVPETAGMLAFSVVLATLGAVALHAGVRSHHGIDHVARLLGLASYPLYLGHGIVAVGASVVVARFELTVAPATFMIVVMSVAISLSLLLGVPLERATLAWRSRWLTRHFTE